MKRMRIAAILSLTSAAVVAQACGGDDNGGPTTADGGAHDASVSDGGGGADTSFDTAADSVVADSRADALPEAGCPSSWTVAPVVGAPIQVPDGGGGVLLHAAATGTQDYTCKASTVDGGTTYAWGFTGPEADLMDCTTTKIGTHFASDGGPTAPEWMTTADSTYVIGAKLGALTPDGGASAVPWLLLQATSHGGTGTLSRAGYVQRVNTTGGLAPSTTCDVNNVGTSQKVAYTADYYFFGM